MEWKKIERSVHNFKEVNAIEGELIEKIQSQFEGSDFVIKTKEGEFIVYGKTALQTKLGSVKIGSKIKIVYVGDKKSEKTGRTYEDFEVYVKE